MPVGHERLDEVDSLGYDSDSDIEDDDDDDDPELRTTKIAGAKLSSEGVSTTEEELEKASHPRLSVVSFQLLHIHSGQCRAGL